MSEEANCLFCRIGQGEIPVHQVEATEHFLAFLDIHPHAPGHTIIIPKTHLLRYTDLPLELAQEFVKITQGAIKRLSQSLETADFTLGINEGELAGRSVPHLHFHILPRFKKDGGGSIHSVVQNYPKESVETIFQRLNS